MLSSKYVAAIVLIVATASIGWFILGGTLVVRTAQSDSAQRAALAALWGSELEQQQPVFSLELPARKGRRPPDVVVSPSASRITADLALDQRRKGMLWYDTYGVEFDGTFAVAAPSRGTLHMVFPMPSDTATYDGLTVTVDGKRVAATSDGRALGVSVPAAPGRTAAVRVHYRSRGLGQWTYRFSSGVTTAHDVVLTMHTNFKAIDFPTRTLAPTQKRATANGWELTWSYRDLVTGAGIGMTFPSSIQPGPLAERLTFWAPLSLGFYVFAMLVITTLRRIELHPINYLFLAAAFFAFHLLFAYTVDRIPVEYAFVLCSVVSLALTISYLRLVVGLRFAAVEAAAAQFFYLILFSLALFDEGYSGLAITAGAIVSLFVAMQLTGRIRWSERFGSGTRHAPATPS